MMCDTCGHKQNYVELGDGDRCCRLKNIPTEHSWRMCNGEYYIDKCDGLSLYSLTEWFKTLSDDEKNKPLSVTFSTFNLEPVMVLKVADGSDWCWSVYCKSKNDDLGDNV